MAALVLSVILISCGGDDNGSGDSPPSYWNRIDWQTTEVGKYAAFTYNGLAPSCSKENSTFAFFHKRGTVNKLIIYFQGGGACWDYNNCVTETRYNSEMQIFEQDYYFDMMGNQESLAISLGYGGIFDFTKTDNPFKDWHMVYIPYCTADLHWGATDTTYTKAGSPDAVIRHRGHVNFQLVLQWLKDHYTTSPDDILVTGISGGGYGAIMNYPFIREAFSTANFYHIGDSAAGVLHENFTTLSTASSGITQWNVQLPLSSRVGGDFDIFNGVDVKNITIVDLYSGIAGYYSADIFAQLSPAYDDTQIYFYYVMKNIAIPGWTGHKTVLCEWNDGLNANFADTYAAVSGVNYTYFIGPGDSHTKLMTADLYTSTSDGTRLIDWINHMLTGGASYVNVDCGVNCSPPAEPTCP